MRWSRVVFWALYCAGPATLLAGAIFVMAAGLFGADPVWRQTEFDLKTAVESRSRVALKVFAERTDNIDAPVDYVGPEVGQPGPVALAPLVIAVMREYGEIVRILLESGSNPAVAFSNIHPDVAAALRRYAARSHPDSMLREYLAKYSPGPASR